jgi:hypothetical protein
MDPSKFTVHCVASRNYQILDENGDPLVGEDGVPIRYLSAGAARIEIRDSIADARTSASEPEGRQVTPAGLDVADAVTEASAPSEGRYAEVLAAVRNEVEANPSVGVSALYRNLRAAGVKVSKRFMDPALATVRGELVPA